MSSKYHTLICMYIYVLYIKSLSVNKLRIHLHTHQYIFSYLSSLLCYSITAYQSSLKWWACLSFTRWMSCISASKNDNHYWAWASYISTYYKWCNLNKRYWCDQDDSKPSWLKRGLKSCELKFCVSFVVDLMTPSTKWYMDGLDISQVRLVILN